MSYVTNMWHCIDFFKLACFSLTVFLLSCQCSTPGFKQTKYTYIWYGKVIYLVELFKISQLLKLVGS